MARAKARFLGEDLPLIAASRSITHKVVADFVSKHADSSSADFTDLAENIESAAWLARQMILMAYDDSSAQDACAELSLLLQWASDDNLNPLIANWPKLSPDVWNSLRCHVALDPFDKGDFGDIANLQNAIAAALDGYTVSKRRPHEVQHAAALELTRRVEAALTPHTTSLHISLTTYANNYTCTLGTGQSVIVELLHAVGSSIDIKLEMTGWRDILSEVRRGG